MQFKAIGGTSKRKRCVADLSEGMECRMSECRSTVSDNMAEKKDDSPIKCRGVIPIKS